MQIDHRLKIFGLGMTRLFLFGAELLSLSVFCNCLFLVPEPYFGQRGLYILASAVLAALSALAGGRIALVMSRRGASPPKALFTTFPVVFCSVILSLSTLIFALALLDMKLAGAGVFF